MRIDCIDLRNADRRAISETESLPPETDYQHTPTFNLSANHDQDATSPQLL